MPVGRTTMMMRLDIWLLSIIGLFINLLLAMSRSCPGSPKAFFVDENNNAIHGGPGMLSEYWMTGKKVPHHRVGGVVLHHDLVGQATLLPSRHFPPRRRRCPPNSSSPNKTLEVAKYLRQRFGPENIYVMAQGCYITSLPGGCSRPTLVLDK